MSKLSFRARALDASKPMPIYMAEELPDLPDYSAINRAVPQMPSGMQKEEECEHHLQRAICTGLIIPTPEVTSLTDADSYEKIYPGDYKQPRQLIHMQPFAMENDIPDYDMDSEDENWVASQSRKMDITALQFEEMMDRLEKSSGQKVVSLSEAKALLKEDDDLIIAVFDYWLNKRLITQHPLLLSVKTEQRVGMAANNPYLAFRRRTEKMQTRKNRKNDETSYEKMLKLRRDLSRAVTLLEMVKKREKTKREYLHLTIEIYEKRYQAQDFSGSLLSEVTTVKSPRPAFAPIFTNQFGTHQNWTNRTHTKETTQQRKEKRQYRKRKFKDNKSRDTLVNEIHNGTRDSDYRAFGSGLESLASSDEEDSALRTSQTFFSENEEEIVDDGLYVFKRNRHNNYLAPLPTGLGCRHGSSNGDLNNKYKYSMTSINKPTLKCIGLARRRIGRGGRVILDRLSHNIDDLWGSLGFTIHKSKQDTLGSTSPKVPDSEVKELHYRPKTMVYPDNHNVSEESSESENDDNMSEKSTPGSTYPFPAEAASICIDIEPSPMESDTSFSAEFNIGDYFSMDSVTNFENDLMNCDNFDYTDLGCSKFSIPSDAPKIFATPTNSQNSESFSNKTVNIESSPVRPEVKS
ncbi:hypothetical protein TKK_0001740 [Trichogramma kaykai]|uniref:Enhancer of polycomb-like protein n=1 Tax=Trichogramma kaykai TaxID=54128 RepID=A0ABD2XFQ3_9HYME